MACSQADVLMAVSFQCRQALIERRPLAGLAGNKGTDRQSIGVEQVGLSLEII